MLLKETLGLRCERGKVKVRIQAPRSTGKCNSSRLQVSKQRWTSPDLRVACGRLRLEDRLWVGSGVEGAAHVSETQRVSTSSIPFLAPPEPQFFHQSARRLNRTAQLGGRLLSLPDTPDPLSALHDTQSAELPNRNSGGKTGNNLHLRDHPRLAYIRGSLPSTPPSNHTQFLPPVATWEDQPALRYEYPSAESILLPHFYFRSLPYSILTGARRRITAFRTVL